jgi:uncharacterized protein YbaA (DUF1428 family)
MQNSLVESFNGRLLDDCFNEHLFTSYRPARNIIRAWRQEYKQHKEVEYWNSDQPLGEGSDFKRTGRPWLHDLLVVLTVAAELALEENLHAAAFRVFCKSAIASTTASKGGDSPKIMALMAR